MRVSKNLLRNSNGFTLMEVVIVVSIMGILGLIFTNTLMQALRGQNKVRALSQVKQNGQSVLDRMSNAIRQSERIVCVGFLNGQLGTTGDTLIIYKKGTYSRFRFYPENNLGCTNTVPNNGCMKQNDFSVADIPSGVSDKDLCTTSTDLGLSGNVAILTDSDTLNGVSIKQDGENPIFRKNSSPGFFDTLTVDFGATSGVSSGQTYEFQAGSGSVVFSTTVQAKGGK